MTPERSGCPCTIVDPCGSNCTCADPVRSGGCRMCCQYGSETQRRLQARRLVDAVAHYDRHLLALGVAYARRPQPTESTG